jgi:hypothetical protein
VVKGALAWAALVGLGAALRAQPARADDTEDILIGSVGAAVVLTDVAFLVRDVVLVAGGAEAEVGVSIAEAAFAAPQALFLNVGLGFVAQDHYGYETVPLVLPTSMITALMVHGTWSAITPDADPARLFGASTVIGIDVAWTSLAVGQLAGGELPMAEISPWIVGTTAPGLALSIRQAVVDESFRSGWVATAAGSGLLVAYGVAGIFGAWDPSGEDEDYPVALLPWAPSGPFAIGENDTEGASAGVTLVGRF